MCQNTTKFALRQIIENNHPWEGGGSAAIAAIKILASDSLVQDSQDRTIRQLTTWTTWDDLVGQSLVRDRIPEGTIIQLRVHHIKDI